MPHQPNNIPLSLPRPLQNSRHSRGRGRFSGRNVHPESTKHAFSRHPGDNHRPFRTAKETIAKLPSFPRTRALQRTERPPRINKARLISPSRRQPPPLSHSEAPRAGYARGGAGHANQTTNIPSPQKPHPPETFPLSRSAGEGWGEGPGRRRAYQLNHYALRHRNTPNQLKPTSFPSFKIIRIPVHS